MKKITLFFVAMLFTLVTIAQNVLSHSTDQTLAAGAVACANGAGGFSLENSWFRAYTPADFGYAGNFDIMGAQFGVSFTDTGATDPIINVTVKAYTSDAVFPAGTLTEIATASTTVMLSDALLMKNINFDAMATVDASTEVIIEVFIESAEIPVADVRIAGNDLGQDDPSYILSATCAITVPTDLTDIGFPNSHIVLNLLSPAPPANDECANAEALTVNTDATCANVTAGTILLATDSGVSDNGSGTPNDDVWFTFVATETEHVIKMLNKAGTYTDLVHEVLSGDCATLVSVNVSDPDSSTVSGLTVGDTYYLRVFGWSGTAGRDTTFDVCVTTIPLPPANDDCANADAIIVNTDTTCTNVTSGTIAGATDSGVSDNGSGTPNDDVWFTFVATDTDHIIKMLNKAGTYTDLVHEVLSGDCATLVSVNVSDPDTSTVSGLTVGDTYYLRVFGWSGTAGRDTTFDVCVTTVPPPPANDDFANAEMLTVNATCTNTLGTNVSATASVETPFASCGSTDGTEGDVWYTFVAPADGNITVTTSVGTATDLDTVMAMYSYDGTTLTQIDCSDDGAGIAPFSEIVITDGSLVGGDTYYVRIHEYNDDSSDDFNICAVNASASIDDLQAVGFNYYPNPVSNDLNLRANENITNVSIFNMLGQEVKSIAPSSLETTINMSNLANGTYFVKAQVGDAVGTFKVVKK